MLLCPSRQVGWSGGRRQEKTRQWCFRHGRLPSAARWLCQSHVWTWQKEGNVVHMLFYVFAFTYYLWSPIVQFLFWMFLRIADWEPCFENDRLVGLYFYFTEEDSHQLVTIWFEFSLLFLFGFGQGHDTNKHFALIKITDLSGALGWSRREEGCRQKTRDWFCCWSDRLGENHRWEWPTCSESSQSHQVFLGDFVMTIVQHLRWVSSNSALLSSQDW